MTAGLRERRKQQTREAISDIATAMFAERGFDEVTIAQVADVIAGSAGLAISPSTDGPVRSWLHRYATTARHIHWGG